MNNPSHDPSIPHPTTSTQTQDSRLQRPSTSPDQPALRPEAVAPHHNPLTPLAPAPAHHASVPLNSVPMKTSIMHQHPVVVPTYPNPSGSLPHTSQFGTIADLPNASQSAFAPGAIPVQHAVSIHSNQQNPQHNPHLPQSGAVHQPTATSTHSQSFSQKHLLLPRQPPQQPQPHPHPLLRQSNLQQSARNDQLHPAPAHQNIHPRPEFFHDSKASSSSQNPNLRRFPSQPSLLTQPLDGSGKVVENVQALGAGLPHVLKMQQSGPSHAMSPHLQSAVQHHGPGSGHIALSRHVKQEPISSMPLPIHPDPVQSFPQAQDQQDSDRPFNFGRHNIFDELGNEENPPSVPLPPPPSAQDADHPSALSGVDGLPGHVGVQAGASGANLPLPGITSGAGPSAAASPSTVVAAAAAASLQPIAGTVGQTPLFLGGSSAQSGAGSAYGLNAMLVPPQPGCEAVADGGNMDERERAKAGLPPSGPGHPSQAFARRLRGIPRSRSQQMTESERKQRHNQHTRASRSRIDRGLERLKAVIRKVRPNQKVTKKADVLHEAVKLLEEGFRLPPTDSDDERDGPGDSSLSV